MKAVHLEEVMVGGSILEEFVRRVYGVYNKEKLHICLSFSNCSFKLSKFILF